MLTARSSEPTDSTSVGLHFGYAAISNDGFYQLSHNRSLITLQFGFEQGWIFSPAVRWASETNNRCVHLARRPEQLLPVSGPGYSTCAPENICSFGTPIPRSLCIGSVFFSDDQAKNKGRKYDERREEKEWKNTIDVRKCTYLHSHGVLAPDISDLKP